MKVNKADLLRALEIVKPGLASKELIEQSTSFAFMDGHVVTYNDEISIKHPVEGLELEGAILAENLYKFLSKIKKENVELDIKNNEIILTSGKAKAGLTLQTEIKLPVNEELSEMGKWKRLPENFVANAAFVMTAAGTNMSEPKLTCVHVNQAGFVEASDGFRIARHELSSEMPIASFLIPATTMVEINKLDPKPTRIAEGQGWVRFKNTEGTVISCRIFKESYKNLASALDVQGTRLPLPKTINEVLDRAMVFAKRGHILEEQVHITINNKILEMSAQSDTGWFKEEIELPDFKSFATKFSITPYLLKGILNETLMCLVSQNRIKFEGTGWVYVGVLRDPKDVK